LLPVWMTGGIHLDGFADVWDALSSHAAPKRRREILRDPHCGAFAVIHLCMYFTASLALWAALEPDGRVVLCMDLAFVLSRALSGFLLLTLPVAEGSRMAEAFQSHASERVKTIVAVEAALSAAGVLSAGGVSGLLMLAAAGLAVWRYVEAARACFGGTSGDLAGWFLQRSELWMLAALVLGQYMGF
ncbi:MAG: adenosylcobinamide-GDP ribazoletransferase, partial [Oscillibacter sp.]|nr:adenosylcobinamide-GDP ribazoletransferase [Oscillibacter sp.]